MAIVDLKAVAKSYGPRTVLCGVDLTVDDGERLGLVGVNGSGKTTLARIIAGLELPDEGSVVRRREATFALLDQSPNVDPTRTPRAEVLSGLGPWSAARARYDRITRTLSEQAPAAAGTLEKLLAEQAQAAADVEQLGGWDLGHVGEAILGHLNVARLDAPLGTMSGGEQRRVALARTLVSGPDIAILDEPTNHLDVKAIEWLETFLLESYQRAVLLISHDRYLLERVATRTLEIDRGKLYGYPGSYSVFLEHKAARLDLEARRESNRQGFLRSELEWLNRQPKARSGKQKARIQRAEAAIADTPQKEAAPVRLAASTCRAGRTSLSISELTVTLGDRVLIKDLSFILLRGQRVGILGDNGAGKSTLLKVILGELAPTSGTVTLAKNTTPIYLSQARDTVDPEKSIVENVADGFMTVSVGDERMDTRSYLARFQFAPDTLDQPVGALSGGERTRVALARLLRSSTNLVILDEPTNDLDVMTLGMLEQLLLELGVSLVFVTHDRWFLDRVATDLLVFEGQGRVTHYAGAYSTYVALRPQSSALDGDDAPPGSGRREDAGSGASAGAGSDTRKPRVKRALTYGERIELDGLMDRVEQAEARVAALEGALARPELYQKPHADVPALLRELEQAKTQAAAVLARWEELEQKSDEDAETDRQRPNAGKAPT